MKQTHGRLRKPSFTCVVRAGLQTMIASHPPRTEEERRAARWIAEACDHANRFTAQEKLKAMRRRQRKEAA